MQSQSASWAMKYEGWTVEPYNGNPSEVAYHAANDPYYNADGTPKQ